MKGNIKSEKEVFKEMPSLELGNQLKEALHLKSGSGGNGPD